MNCREYGKAPYKAIVLHGGPGAPGCCAGICRGLSERTGVLEHLQEGNSVWELTEEIRGIILRYQLGETVLIGHSYGAWLSFIFAAQYPQHVSKLILVGSGMFDERYFPQLIENRSVNTMSDEQREDVRASGLYSTDIDYDPDYYCVFPNLPEDMIAFNEPQFKSLWDEAHAMRKTGELLRFADKIRCPVTAIHGKNDPHPAEGIIEPLENRLSVFKMYMLDKCGHDPWKEYYAKDEFFAILEKELNV